MIAIVGGGSWGTALAIHLARSAGAVRLWAREPEVVEGIRTRRRSPWYLPDLEIPSGVDATTEVAEAVRGASLVVVAVPSEFFAATLKSVMAIATGLVDGLGLGENARAALITRGLAEMTRLAVALGAMSATLAGLAGLGDLVLTCTGSLSRNRQLGIALTKGETVAAVEDRTRMVAEGVRTVTSALALARRHGVSMPICQEVGAVLFDGKAPTDALASLLERPLRREEER